MHRPNLVRFFLRRHHHRHYVTLFRRVQTSSKYISPLSTRPLHHGHLIIRRLTTGGPGSSFLPRFSFFRLFWTGSTALAGFIYYKFNQASSWLQEQFETINEWSMAIAISLSDGLDSFIKLLPARRTHKPLEDQSSEQGDIRDTNLDSVLISEDLHMEEESPSYFRDFIKKMIEIRNTLRSANLEDENQLGSNPLMLPSIVVIGSQSAGKSSVLESIVGHEFLPKGTNMVTRRPIELTLVNCSTTRDYAILGSPSGNHSPIYDFAEVRKRLEELNAAIPSDEWISTTPIDLTIYSRHVPDLTLIDLPGYIAVTNRYQPPILREKIAALCERYIRPRNLILAVCAADVDLANAEALQAARQVDPQGERTIGVLTKLDLVEPQYAVNLLRSDAYPLRLGYIGVVCQPTVSTSSKVLSLLGNKTAIESSKSQQIPSYFIQNQRILEPVQDQLGFDCLRRRLTMALEATMTLSLSGVLARVQEELREVRYALKVEFNDRPLHPEAYIAHLVANVRQGLERVAREYSRARVRDILRHTMEERLLGVCQEIGWEGVDLARVDVAVDQLGRSGVGRLVATTLVDAILGNLKVILREGPIGAHPQASERLIAQVEGAMSQRAQITIDQVENAIKPWKHDVELGSEEWRRARRRLIKFLEQVEGQWTRRLTELQVEIGPRRLRKILERLSQEQSVPSTETEKVMQESERENVVIPNPLITKAKEIVDLNKKLQTLRRRIHVQSQKECAQLADSIGKVGIEQSFETNSWWKWLSSFYGSGQNYYHDRHQNLKQNNQKDYLIKYGRTGQHGKCPEIYLYAVMEKLLATAALHAHHELVYEFLHPFPEELTSSSLPSSFNESNRSELMTFLQENQLVFRHYQLWERRRILEEVRDKLQFLEQLSNQGGTGTDSSKIDKMSNNYYKKKI